jgi:hypothetical protein
MSLFWPGDGWALRVGIGRTFWGATEFVHLVDIVNQTDLVESFDGEEKMGQPMAHLSILRRWGVLDLFVLPLFRERTFSGRGGRLRSPIVMDTDRATYESGRERRHVDLAARHSRSIGAWDVGLSHFYGTGREPTLLPGANGNGEPVFIPFYELIHQTGVDVQGMWGAWLFKLEALRRTGQGSGFLAAVGGFEYTFVNVGPTGMNLGVLGEWAWDQRGRAATTPFQSDIMLGLRLALNDPASSQLLVGILQDTESPERIIQVEGSRRFGSSWRATVEARAFVETGSGNPLHALCDDDFLRVGVSYYY